MRFIVSLAFFAGLLGAIWLSLSQDERARLVLAVQQKMQSAPAVSPATPAVTPAAEYARMEYTQPPAQCTPRAVTPEPVTGQRVYRWQDASGRWHYGDKPPATVAAEDLSDQFPAQKKHVSLQWLSDTVSPALREQVAADAERIFNVYASFLPAAASRQVAVKVHAFADPEDFAQWRDARDRSSAANAGMYDALGREAAVVLSGDPAWDAGVIRHEITHAIHYELLARPPVWFDEGMAEVFNMLSYRHGRWQAASWRMPHIARLAGTSAGQMLTELNRTDWPGDDPMLSYARAWSMAAFLLSAPDASVFPRYLQWLEAHYCQTVDSREFMAEHYPGGESQWQADWQAWVQQQAASDGSAVWWQRLPQG